MWLKISDFFHTYVVGSSRKITGGLFTSSKAIESLFLSPPESRSVGVFLTCINLSMSKISSIWNYRKCLYDSVRLQKCSEVSNPTNREARLNCNRFR